MKKTTWRWCVVSAAAAIGAWLLLTASAEAQSQAAPLSQRPITSTARDVLRQIRPSVIEIRGFVGANTAKAFHGSGFAVGEGGLFMTNYHVVAPKVNEPDQYRLEYRTEDARTGQITVIGVDARHDLALVRASGHAPAPLTLSTAIPAKGSRAYAVGFPFDIGLTITEGVSNGEIEDSFDKRIHYSGALNPGMSGGPAFNGNTEVIGVNVSGIHFSQSVAFLVPAIEARALLERAGGLEPGPEQLKKDVTAQTHDHAKRLLAALDNPIPVQVTSGYALPDKLAPFIDCSATGGADIKQPVQQTRIACSAKAGVFLGERFSTGNLIYTHHILTTDKLDAWRFAGKLSALTTSAGWAGARKHVGPFACQDRIVALKGFDASVVVCSRAYRDLGALFDFTIRIASLNGEKSGVVSHLDLNGFDFDGGMDFVHRYIEALEWRP